MKWSERSRRERKIDLYVGKSLMGGREAVNIVAYSKGDTICWHHDLSEKLEEDALKYAREVARELKEKQIYGYVLINGQNLIASNTSEGRKEIKRICEKMPREWIKVFQETLDKKLYEDVAA